jgi:predicted nucleic acid-binding protein
VSAPSTGFVLDASVAAKWFTRHEEADRDRALELRALHEEGRCRLVAPEILLLEMLNAVRFSRRAEETETLLAIEGLERLRLELMPLDGALLRQASVIAWKHDSSLYDATYVAIAELVGLPLLTADDVLAKKMRGHRLVLRLRDARLA